MRQLKTKQQYKKQLQILLKLTAKRYPEVLNRKIDVDRFCNDSVYRCRIRTELKNIERIRARDRIRNKKRREYNKECHRKWLANNREYCKEYTKKYMKSHPGYTKKCFEKWTINNPRKAMMSAAAAHMAIAVINRLGIRPTVCPHCGKEHCLIDFHHPNHLFWWKGTFCCKSCHYYFNRNKVPASDTIIDLKKLLRESNSH